MTDGKGRTVDFTNTIVVMTSNIGSHWIAQMIDADPAELRRRVQDALREHFRPEFLNRIDETIVFNPLSRELMKSITDIQIARLRARLAERALQLDVTPAAVALLAEVGYDPAYGARPLKRTIQRELENPLALSLLEGELREGSHVSVDAEGGTLRFAVEPPDQSE
jgi:ATP-dependent Clp protease ATP-binding subunit ClpB